MQRRAPLWRRPRAGATSRDVLSYCQLPFCVNMSFEILELQARGYPNKSSIARPESQSQSGGAPTFDRSWGWGLGLGRWALRCPIRSPNRRAGSTQDRREHATLEANRPQVSQAAFLLRQCDRPICSSKPSRSAWPRFATTRPLRCDRCSYRHTRPACRSARRHSMPLGASRGWSSA